MQAYDRLEGTVTVSASRPCSPLVSGKGKSPKGRKGKREEMHSTDATPERRKLVNLLQFFFLKSFVFSVLTFILHPPERALFTC